MRESVFLTFRLSTVQAKRLSYNRPLYTRAILAEILVANLWNG